MKKKKLIKRILKSLIGIFVIRMILDSSILIKEIKNDATDKLDELKQN